MADDSPEVAALKEAKAKAEAEKDLAKAQLEKIQAERDLAAAQTGKDAAGAKAAADTLAAVFAQQKAAAEAQTAAIAAQQNAIKAQFGTVTGSALTGTVTTTTGAGNGEASLLAAKALVWAAQNIAGAVKRNYKNASFIMFAGTQKPMLGHWYAFQVQLKAAESSFDKADADAKDAENAASSLPANGAKVNAFGKTESVGAAITGAGAILDAASKLGSFFQSDYTIGAATVAGSDDDLLAVTVAGMLEDASYPARFSAPPVIDPISSLLNPLSTRRVSSLAAMRVVKQQADAFKSAADKATDAISKDQFKTVASAYDRATDSYTAAQKRYDDLVAALAAEKDGTPMAALVADEKTLADKLANGAIALFVHVNIAAGGYYTKKNLWTFFGGMPFYVSGGAVVSYTAIEGKTGKVGAAGQFQLFNGYRKMSKVEEMFPTPR